MKKFYILTFILASFFAMTSFGQQAEPKPISDTEFNALAPTPPMGWNSWNRFACDVDEQLIRSIADAMVSTGMKEAGYTYVVIDDCWQIGRDAEGNILVDSKRFPSGMKALADYIHSLGLKFGIYSCAGSETCAGRPGSRGYQFQDARTYADWGVDYLKYDFCFSKDQSAKAAYRTMSDALKASGRPIVFSICEWGSTQPWTWGKGIGHLWRTTGDIKDAYHLELDWGGLGMLNIVDRNAPLDGYAGPGHWNDADMLEIGNGGMTTTEYITHMSLWCMMASPLMCGNDIRNMDSETKRILLNQEVIAINQDPLGIQGHPYMTMGDKQVWGKRLSDGNLALCFLNRGSDTWNLSFDWDFYSKNFSDTSIYQIRDLWKHSEMGTTKKTLEAHIEPHGVLMLKLTKIK